MLIDFHAHVFPDSVAGKAIASLKKGLYEKQGKDYPALTYADGTVNGLLNSMEENNVNLSIAMPVVTSAKQTDSINRFAQSITGNKIISFAGIFPLSDDWEIKMEEIKKNGFMGIKLHSEFQQLYLDSVRAVDILRKARDLGLIVMLHAGEDPGVICPDYSSPRRIAEALAEVSGVKLIAAHMGGWGAWDEVEKYLVGKDVYFDISMVSGFLPAEQCKRIIKNHGSGKILFGTDSPWQKPSDVVEYLESMNLSADEFADITYKNALKLLGMNE